MKNDDMIRDQLISYIRRNYPFYRFVDFATYSREQLIKLIIEQELKDKGCL